MFLTDPTDFDDEFEEAQAEQVAILATVVLMEIVPVPLKQLSRVARKIGVSAPDTLIHAFPGSTYGGGKVKAYLVRANGEAQLYVETQ